MWKSGSEHRTQCIECESGNIKRRGFTAGLLSLIAGLAFAWGLKPAQAAVTEAELEPFKKIAKDKNFKFRLLKRNTLTTMAEPKMHLDMDMVRASLRNAIERAKEKKLTRIQERLERLLSSGTASQQVDFVLGSGSKYFFPEDVERLAAQAEKDKFQTFGYVCDVFCWVSCKCVQNEQQCQERCREIFCPDK